MKWFQNLPHQASHRESGWCTLLTICPYTCTNLLYIFCGIEAACLQPLNLYTQRSDNNSLSAVCHFTGCLSDNSFVIKKLNIWQTCTKQVTNTWQISDNNTIYWPLWFVIVKPFVNTLSKPCQRDWSKIHHFTAC